MRNALSQAAATETAAADNGGNSGSDGTNTVNKENTENNTTAVTGTLPYNDGVYYGTAEGYNGDITVAIVIQEKTLKAVLSSEKKMTMRSSAVPWMWLHR